MKAGVALVALCLMAGPARSENGPVVDGFSLVQPQWTEARQEPLDPGDALDITGASVEVAGIFDVKCQGFTARVRATAAGRTDEGNWPSEDNLKVLEAQWTGSLTDRLTLSAGKRILSWDPGYAAQPLGFFQSETVLSDITDEAGRAEGVPLAAATWLGDDWSATAAISDDFATRADGYRRGLRQWAIRVSRQFGAADVAIVVQQPEGAPPGLGGSYSTAIGEYLSLHASAFAGAHRLSVEPTVIAGNTDYLSNPTPPFQVERSRTITADILLGGVFTPIRGLTTVAEYIHNGQGFSDTQWKGFVQGIDTARLMVGTPYDRLAEYQLGLDGQALAASNIRRDYVFASATYEVGRWSLGQSTLFGFADSSATTISSVEYRPDDFWSVTAVFQLFEGGQATEFGIIPVRFQSYMRVRRAF